jgi:hypothetical protein
VDNQGLPQGALRDRLPAFDAQLFRILHARQMERMQAKTKTRSLMTASIAAFSASTAFRWRSAVIERLIVR